MIIAEPQEVFDCRGLGQTEDKKKWWYLAAALGLFGLAAVGTAMYVRKREQGAW